MFSAIFSKTGKGGTFLNQATLARAADSRSGVLTGTAYLSNTKLNQKKRMACAWSGIQTQDLQYQAKGKD
jgi:hypothetical protein